jgi:YtfJ family uncharacterized protein
MKYSLLAALSLSLCSFASQAVVFSFGEKAPTVAVADKGELFVDGDKITYKSWDSEQMLGKTRVLHIIAGRKSAKALNAPLMDAITEAKFPEDKYQTTTIVNQDDAMWGTGSFVKSSLEDSKRESFWSSMVLDADGNVAKAWELQKENSFIAVQDATGTILWMKEGALDESEIAQVMALVSENL